MKLLFWQAEEAVKMMEIELGSGWIGHQHCKVDNVLLHLKIYLQFKILIMLQFRLTFKLYSFLN
jgi:hypothetical protein